MLNCILERAAAVVAAGLLAGCSDLREAPRGDLFIRSVLALAPEDCNARDDPEATSLAFGILDTSFGGATYIAPLLVGNSIPTDVRGVSLRSASVSVSDHGGKGITAFTFAGNGFVSPPGASGPGYGVMFVELLPPDLVAEPLRLSEFSPVQATVRVFGELAGGVGVESSELTFRIDVCAGCLIEYPVSAIDPARGNTCSLGEPERRPTPCILGQDMPIDCRLCQGINPFCYAIPAPPF